MQDVPLKCHKKPSTPHGTKMHKITNTQTKQRWKLLDLKGYTRHVFKVRSGEPLKITHKR